MNNMDVLDKKHTLYETPLTKISFSNNNYGFKLEDIRAYVSKYKELKEKNVVETGEFYDTTWVLYTHPGRSKRTSSFTFDLELYKEFNLALKCYVVHLIDINYSLDHVRSLYSNIRQSFIESMGFDPNFLTPYEDILMALPDRKKEGLITSTLHFAEFYPNLWNGKYEKLFKSVSLEKRKVRTLPKYESVIQFNDVLLDFMDNCNENERKKYMPILLWWRISTIIPLRPIEFLDIKANCTSSGSGKYKITVPRKKQRGKGEIEVINTLQITKEIYDLVEEYLYLQGNTEKTGYLMAYMPYNSFVKERFQEGAKKRRNRTDKMENGQLKELLNEFYMKIVGEQYGYPSIDRVKLGDARHFAFCNMMLQGYNSLTIARIGGHSHLKSQLSYTCHLDYFAEARVRVLSEAIKRNRVQDLGEIALSNTNSIVIRSKLRKGETSSRPIQGGFCRDDDFPNNCIDDCLFCYPYFQLDLANNPDALKSLNLTSSKYAKRIKEQIETMQRFSADMLYDKSTLQYSQEDQEELSILAKKLRELFHKKAIIDSYIPESI